MSNKKDDQVSKGQGPTEATADSSAESIKVETPDLATVRKWLKDDLGRALSLLNALHSDQELQNTMADWMLGRIGNWKNKQELDKNQLSVFGKGPKPAA